MWLPPGAYRINPLLFTVELADATEIPQGKIGVVEAHDGNPLPIVVGKQFSLKTTQYASESAALTAIDQRKIDGGIVAGPAGSKLIVVPAAGAAGPSRETDVVARQCDGASFS